MEQLEANTPGDQAMPPAEWSPALDDTQPVLVSDPARLRVLVVDDNRDAATSLGVLVGIMGHEVRTEHEGTAAVAAAISFRPDVALLDLGLPGLDGLHVAREIQEQPGGQRILLIAVTGWGGVEDRQRSKAAGFSHHLVKPLNPAELTRLLATVSPSAPPSSRSKPSTPAAT